jgi:hypothetical protein
MNMVVYVHYTYRDGSKKVRAARTSTTTATKLLLLLLENCAHVYASIPVTAKTEYVCR